MSCVSVFRSVAFKTTRPSTWSVLLKSRHTFTLRRTSCLRLSLNRSQYGGCSTKYDTSAYIQVVCRWFRRGDCERSGSRLNLRISCLDMHSVHGYRSRRRLCSLLLQRANTYTSHANHTSSHSSPNTYPHFMTRRDSDLEAFSHNPTDVASRH